MHNRTLTLFIAALALLLLGCPSPQIEQAPVILFPTNGAVYEEGMLVSCTASSDAVWTSSVDGALGSGKTISIDLSPGEHCISAASAEGSTSSINLVVRPAEYVAGTWKILRSSVASASCVLAPGAYKIFAVGGDSSCTVSVDWSEYQKASTSIMHKSTPPPRILAPVLQVPKNLFSKAKKAQVRSPGNVKAGDTRQFRVANPEYGTSVPGWTVNAECVYADASIAVWKDSEYTVDPDILADYLEKLMTIALPRAKALWGAQEEPDNDGKLALLLTGRLNEQELAVGFFNPCDYFTYNDDPSSADYNPTSNEMDILYMGIPAANEDRNFNRYSLLATAAHEYQHLVRFSRKTWIRLVLGDPNPPMETPSFDEGMSHLTETLVGYGVSGGNVAFAARYLAGTADFSLCGLDRNGADDSAGKRGMAALFLYYLFSMKGGLMYSQTDPALLVDKGGLAFLANSIDYYGTGWDYARDRFSKELQSLLLDFGKSILENSNTSGNTIDTFTGEPVNLDPWMGPLTSPCDPGLTFMLDGPVLLAWCSEYCLIPSSLVFLQSVSKPEKSKLTLIKKSGAGNSMWGFYMRE
mgnify:CR=1 FL=1